MVIFSLVAGMLLFDSLQAKINEVHTSMVISYSLIPVGEALSATSLWTEAAGCQLMLSLNDS